jgi:crossover junction endodeoxyribonuclease RusA
MRGLPLPPSLNNAYATYQGRRILSKEGRAYKAQAALLIRRAAADQGFIVPAATPLGLAFRFWFARNNRDGSNTPKLLEDALAEALGFNDVWVWRSAWTKAIDKDNPRCDVSLEILSTTGTE